MTENQTKASATQNVEGLLADAANSGKSPCLLFSRGKDIGRRFELHGERTTLGRSLEANVVLHDESVSHLHCCILQAGSKFTIQDLQSRNGTYVNSQRVSEALLSPGIPVQIGRTLFHLDFREPSDLSTEDNLISNATTDALTGVLNRRVFLVRAGDELPLARRTGTPLALAIIDVDNMRQINEACGEGGGNGVLKQVARLVGLQKRREDILARFSGDKFIIMLRGNVKQSGVLTFCERVRQVVAATEFNGGDRRVSLTVSIGAVSLSPGEYRSLEDLMELTDQALYSAKMNGKNRVGYHVIGTVSP
jgi:diguanylate cyclase (GGDEF)-like protein